VDPLTLYLREMTGDGATYDIRALFDRAIGLPPAQLLALLQSLPQTVGEELKALLQADEGAATFLAGAVDRELPEPAGSGQQFGTFRTAELLGRGGMSSVFKAHRIARPARARSFPAGTAISGRALSSQHRSLD